MRQLCMGVYTLFSTETRCSMHSILAAFTVFGTCVSCLNDADVPLLIGIRVIRNMHLTGKLC